MYGLDVFYEPTITLDEARALQSHPGNGVADLAGRLIEFGCRRFESDATTIGDHRDWSGDLAHDPHGQSDVVAEVALAIDGPRFARLWMDTMNAGPTP